MCVCKKINTFFNISHVYIYMHVCVLCMHTTRFTAISLSERSRLVQGIQRPYGLSALAKGPRLLYAQQKIKHISRFDFYFLFFINASKIMARGEKRIYGCRPAEFYDDGSCRGRRRSVFRFRFQNGNNASHVSCSDEFGFVTKNRFKSKWKNRFTKKSLAKIDFLNDSI